MAVNLNNATFGLLGMSGQEAQADPEVRALLADVYDEGVRVLRAAGIRFEGPPGQLDREAHPEPPRARDGGAVPAEEEPRHRPSLWQDLYHGGGQVEADWFNGEIVRLGKAHGVPRRTAGSCWSSSLRWLGAASAPAATRCATCARALAR